MTFNSAQYPMKLQINGTTVGWIKSYDVSMDSSEQLWPKEYIISQPSYTYRFFMENQEIYEAVVPGNVKITAVKDMQSLVLNINIKTTDGTLYGISHYPGNSNDGFVNHYNSPYPSPKVIYDEIQSFGSLKASFGLGRLPEVSKLPGVKEFVKCPVRGERKMLEDVIILLNDKHKWSREQIADWLETLDIDLRFT